MPVVGDGTKQHTHWDLGRSKQDVEYWLNDAQSPPLSAGCSIQQAVDEAGCASGINRVDTIITLQGIVGPAVPLSLDVVVEIITLKWTSALQDPAHYCNPSVKSRAGKLRPTERLSSPASTTHVNVSTRKTTLLVTLARLCTTQRLDTVVSTSQALPSHHPRSENPRGQILEFQLALGSDLHPFLTDSDGHLEQFAAAAGLKRSNSFSLPCRSTPSVRITGIRPCPHEKQKTRQPRDRSTRHKTPRETSSDPQIVNVAGISICTPLIPGPVLQRKNVRAAHSGKPRAHSKFRATWALTRLSPLQYRTSTMDTRKLR